MSESELLTHMNDWLNAGVDSITLYLSVLFAYFVVGHLVGKTLTTARLSVISVIYSVVMASGLFTLYMQFTAIDRFSADLIAIGSKYVTPLPKLTVPVVTGMYAGAFLASHYYMYSRRTQEVF
ncbi:MAG: hypothetical protein ACU84Q_09240 [Gammaproteobacteria bacterium]